MGVQYSHLNPAERVITESALLNGVSQAEIARVLGRSRSTVCREIKRASLRSKGWYLAIHGQNVYDKNRQAAGLARRKLGSDTSCEAWQHVITGLRAGRSPQQIADRTVQQDPLATVLPAPPHRVSHETIYCAIYAHPRGALRSELISLLRRSHGGRRRRSRAGRTSGLQDITSIAVRPSEVADRTVPGHWEGDFLKGANNRSAIGTLVERTSRFTILARMDGTTPTDALEGFTRRMRRIPPALRKTLTYDQGFEMARHKELAKRLRMQIFFCEPYKPSQRGTNENTNGLLRQYLPKGLDLSPFTDSDLAKLEFILNNRPRRVLGYRTPQEVFDELCRQATFHAAHLA
jgi:IS30 family transposase